MDPTFVAGAMTSPTGSMPGDMAWTNNEGKRTPVFYPFLNPYAYMSAETKIRGWNCVPVPALSQKRAGKVIYKRAKHVYPTPVPAVAPDTPQPKRICTTPLIIRDGREHEYRETGVENAGFWDVLSAKVHTRNALYADRVLPVGDRKLSLSRQKHRRDPSGYAAALGQPLTLALLSSLESMADQHVMVLGITDMTDLVYSSSSKEGGSRRRAQLSDITCLSSISECTEPDSPRAISPAMSPTKPKSARSIWTPVKNLTHSLKKSLAKFSPQLNKDGAKQIGVSPPPSTPTLRRSSSLGVDPSPSKVPPKASPVSTESPAHIFTNGKCEATTSSSLGARRRRSLHLQRSRTLSGGRLSLNLPSKESDIVDEDESINVDSWLEDSFVEQTKCQDLQSFKVDFDRKIERRLSEPSRVLSTKAISVDELSVDARTNLDIFSQRPVTAIQSLIEVAATVTTGVPDANVLIERRDGRLVVRFKLPETYVDLSPTDSLLTTDDGDRTTNVPETPLVPSNSMFTTPRITLSQPDEVEHSIGDVSFMSTDTDVLIAGLPDTPTMAVLNGNLSTPRARNFDSVLDTPGTGNRSLWSTDTDELVGGLPDTPTQIVLNPEPNTPQCATKLITTESPFEHDMTRVSTETNGPVDGQLETPIPAGNHIEPGTPENLGGTSANASITWNRVMEDVSFMSTDTDELVGGLPDTPTAIVLNCDLSTPRHAVNTAVSSTPACPYTAGSNMEDVSFLSTNTDELVGGLPDTPTAIVLGAGSNTPSYETDSDTSDTDEAEEALVDNSTIDQTLAADIPSPWVDQRSPEPSDGSDSLPGTPMADETLAVDIPSYFIGRRSTAPSYEPAGGSAENIASSLTSPVGSDIAHDEPVRTSWVAQEQSTSDDVVGRAQADNAAPSPLVLDTPRRVTRGEINAFTTNAISQECEEHTEPSIGQATLSADASIEVAPGQSTESTVAKLSTPEAAKGVNGLEDRAQAISDAASPEPDVPTSPTLAEQTAPQAAAESIHLTSNEPTDAIGSSASKGHVQAIINQESTAQSVAAAYVHKQHDQSSPHSTAFDSDPIFPSFEGHLGAIAEKKLGPQPISLSVIEEEDSPISSDLATLDSSPPTPGFNSQNHGVLDHTAPEAAPSSPGSRENTQAMVDEQSIPLSPTLAAGEERQAEQLVTTRARSSSPVNKSPEATCDRASPSQTLSPGAATGDEPKEVDVTSPPSKHATAATVKTPSPEPARPIPGTLEYLLESPFLPPSSGTPGRATTTASPSRALDHQATELASPRGDPRKQDDPCEPREMPGAAPPAESKNLAEAMEAENKAYLDQFVSQHKASKAAKSANRSPVPASGATSAGSPTPRLPLGQIDANTSSPRKAGTKRKAEDDDAEDAEGSEQAQPAPKRGRRSGSVMKATPPPEASLRRSSRVKAKAEAEPAVPEGGSTIPVRVGSGAFGGPAAGGETMVADLASVTRANTRRNKGKATPPLEVLARHKQDPGAHRMQELKGVHDARAARAGKAPGKGIQWGENHELIYEAEYDDDDENVSETEEKAKEAPAAKTKKKAAAVGRGGQKKGTAEPKPSKVTRSAGVKKTPTQPRTGTPVKRQTRSSTRQTRASTTL